MQQGLIRNHAAVGTPLPHRYRVKKQILAHGPSIHHTLEPGLPIGHLVDLFKHQQICLSAQVDQQLLLQVATHATNRLHCAKKPQLNIANVAESRRLGPATRITNKIPDKMMPNRSISISLDERLLTQLDAQGPSRSALVSEALTQWLPQRRVDSLHIAYADLAKLEGGDLNAAGEDAITMALELLTPGADG